MTQCEKMKYMINIQYKGKKSVPDTNRQVIENEKHIHRRRVKHSCDINKRNKYT